MEKLIHHSNGVLEEDKPWYQKEGTQVVVVDPILAGAHLLSPGTIGTIGSFYSQGENDAIMVSFPDTKNPYGASALVLYVKGCAPVEN